MRRGGFTEDQIIGVLREHEAGVEKLMADHGFLRASRLQAGRGQPVGMQYEPLRGKDDAVRERMREIANERLRFGYRRLAILPRRGARA